MTDRPIEDQSLSELRTHKKPLAVLEWLLGPGELLALENSNEYQETLQEIAPAAFQEGFSTLEKQKQELLLLDCAERVLPLYQNAYPKKKEVAAALSEVKKFVQKTTKKTEEQVSSLVSKAGDALELAFDDACEEEGVFDEVPDSP